MNRCQDCKRPIQSKDAAYYEFTGWAQRRREGGAHHFRHKRFTGNALCKNCAERRFHGAQTREMFG